MQPPGRALGVTALQTGSLAWVQGGAWGAATAGEWWGILAIADEALQPLCVVRFCAAGDSAKASPYYVLAANAAPVGTLDNGYLRSIPLSRVRRTQSRAPMASVA